MSLLNRTYEELYTQIGSYIQDTSSARQQQIKDAINREYAKVVEEIGWPQLMRARTFTLANTDVLYLSKDIGSILLIVDTTDDRVLDGTDIVDLYYRYASSVGVSGAPIKYSFDGEYGQKASFASAETIRFVSSSAADTTQQFVVWGISGGEQKYETITLNGTTLVTSTNSYTEINRISTGDTSRVGVVTVTGSSSSTEYATIARNENTARYKRYKILGNSTNSILLFHKKIPEKLVNAYDIPEIPISMYLFEKVTAEMFQLQRKWAPASFHKAEADKLKMDVLAEIETRSTNMRMSRPLTDRLLGEGNIIVIKSS